MMKKICILLILALLLSACSKTEAPSPPVPEPKTQLAAPSEPVEKVPTWEEQYDLGLRYLSDGNYEEAIIAFTAAIEIDKKRSEGYFSRGQAYYGLSLAVDKNADIELFHEFETLEEKQLYSYENAVQDYEKAIEIDPKIVEYYDEIMRITLEHGDIDLMIRYGEQKFQISDDDNMRDIFENAVRGIALMDQFAEAFQEESDEKIFALMQSNSYQSLLYLQKYLKHSVQREYGDKTLGVYRVDDDEYGDCMIYYGDCVNGIRSGSGAWYGYYNGNNYASHGDWTEDMPNGYFDTKEWNSNLNENCVYRLVSGHVSSGLWNGDVVWAFEMDDEYLSWNCSFVNGIGVIVDKRINPETGLADYFWSTQSSDGRATTLGPKTGAEDEPDGIVGFLPG